MKALDVLIRIVVGIVILMSTLFGVLVYRAPGSLGFRVRTLSNLLGLWAVLIGIAAVCIWIARKVYIEVKKRKIPDFNITKATLLFLRRHHILLGWATILTATAHGVYYLMEYPNRLGRIYTGLLAWSALAVLVALGAWLDYRIKVKKPSKPVRIYHITIATLFIVFMIIHA